MNRRTFLTAAGAIGAAKALSFTEQADALEESMIAELDARPIVRSKLCNFARPQDEIDAELEATQGQLKQMGNDSRLPLMPEKPTLVDFFEKRFAPARHLLQSGALALANGLDEETVLACLLHDVGVFALARNDHGYWGAQFLEPYVSERVSWAIRYHQALRFFPDPSVGYDYPDSYIRYFGNDYEPEPYVKAAAEHAKNHKWYMTARQITINDLYAFDPDKNPTLDSFIDIIGRHFKQPKEGLGFDGSPVAHMWRTVIWPTNFL
jgi:hypothetical protein